MNSKKEITKKLNILFALSLTPLLISLFFSKIQNILLLFKITDSFWLNFYIPQLFYSVIPLFIMIISVSGIFKRGIKDIFKNDLIAFKDALLITFIILGISQISSYIIGIIRTSINVITGKEFIIDSNSLFTMPSGILQTIFFLILVSVIPAICEETIWRGCFAGSLGQYNKKGAIIISAMAFAFMHGNVEQILYAFLFGLLMGYVYFKFNSIWLVIAIHFINNFISGILMIFSKILSEEALSMTNITISFIFIAAGILSLMIYAERHHKDKKGEIESVKGRTFALASVSSPLLWVYFFIWSFITTISMIISSLGGF